ncbi:MAG: FG-GAP repeat protein [Planctomycetes bacterium]|nr:FG-GAP repeat protein [Planctomycetota bacterium]MCC7171445.1 FG-GAP repeat protein [Planctomycetota bacterium]
MKPFLLPAFIAAVLLGSEPAAWSQCSSQSEPPPLPSVVPQQFGHSVAIDGNRMAIASMSFESVGRVFVYERDAQGWQWTATLSADVPNGLLGFEVAIEGDRIAAARNDDSVVMFARDPVTNTWTQSFVIVPGVADPTFGYEMDFVDGRLVIGSFYGDANLQHYGKVYVYAESPAGWSLVQEIVPNDSKLGQNFGYSVEADGNLLLVGSGEAINTSWPGAVYVFELGANGYVQTQKLGSPTWAPDGEFGRDLRIANGRAVVTAANEDGLHGLVHVYDVTPNGLMLQTTLTGSDDPNAWGFGGEIEVVGGRIIALERGANGFVPGIAVYEEVGGTWNCTDRLFESGPNHEYFGFAMAAVGDELIVTNIVQIQQSQDYQGKFVVFRFDDRPFGNGCAGEFGVVPRLDLVGCAIGGEKMGFEIENGFGGGIAFAALGTQKASVPMGAGCSLLIWPILPALVGPLPLNGAGLGSGWCNLGFVVPDPVPSGTYLVQALCSDPTSPLGFTSTNGVELVVP